MFDTDTKAFVVLKMVNIAVMTSPSMTTITGQYQSCCLLTGWVRFISEKREQSCRQSLNLTIKADHDYVWNGRIPTGPRGRNRPTVVPELDTQIRLVNY